MGEEVTRRDVREEVDSTRLNFAYNPWWLDLLLCIIFFPVIGLVWLVCLIVKVILKLSLREL